MKRVLIIGGDNRLRVAKKQLDKENFLVDTMGLYPDDNGSIENSDVIVLPVPTTKDGQTVFAPLSDRKIYLDEIYNRTTNQLILCCNYKFDGKNYIDYNIPFPKNQAQLVCRKNSRFNRSMIRFSNREI